jgi:hypothetical protein
MKKEIALIIGAAVNILLIYPLALFTYLDSNWVMARLFSLIFVVVYCFIIFFTLNTLFNKEKKKMSISVSLIVIAIIATFQLALLLMGALTPITA